MSTRTYRVYTKRKLTEDPEFTKGYVKKSREQDQADNEDFLRAKFIQKSEYESLDVVLDKNLPDKNGKKYTLAF